MAASDTEFPLFRKLPTANQSTTNCTARLEQHLLGCFCKPYIIVRGPVRHETIGPLNWLQKRRKCIIPTHIFISIIHNGMFYHPEIMEYRADHFDRAAA